MIATELRLWLRIALVVILVAAAAHYLMDKHLHKPPTAAVVQTQQLADPAALAAILNLRPATAERLTVAIQQDAPRAPAFTYEFKSPTLATAAAQVRQEVQAGTSPANAVPASTTTVTPNEQRQVVEVRRITMERARIGVSVLALGGGGTRPEVGAGAAWWNRDNVLATGYTSERRIYLLGAHKF